MRTSNRFSAMAAFIGLLAILLAAPATARSVIDSAGRTVEVPDTISRAFAAGPPASLEAGFPASHRKGRVSGRL